MTKKAPVKRQSFTPVTGSKALFTYILRKSIIIIIRYYGISRCMKMKSQNNKKKVRQQSLGAVHTPTHTHTRDIQRKQKETYNKRGNASRNNLTRTFGVYFLYE